MSESDESEGSTGFNAMSIDQVQLQLTQIHKQVCRAKGRVEIRDGDSCCVLISKEELDSLEQALEILSNTSQVQKIARTIAALTHTVAQGPLVATGRSTSN
jgi:PHD/YefM family antitoxin component YafN of YafNO toxin-antitoxin module